MDDKFIQMNRSSLIKERFLLRSPSFILFRIYNIFIRYGWTSETFRSVLFDFVHMVQEFGITPTLPVTASIIDRHPRLFQCLQNLGVEFAIHGYKHIDYTSLKPNEVKDHHSKAINVFKKYGIRFSGYRFPFLRSSNELIRQLSECGFIWDSSKVVWWEFTLPLGLNDKRKKNYNQILESYAPLNADKTVILPEKKNGIIEIPVSVPDDDILFDRLGFKAEKMDVLLRSMLQRVLIRGELLVLQLHPERFPGFKAVLKKILNIAVHEKQIWLASLGEIAEWWQEKSQSYLKINRLSKERYNVSAICQDRTVILTKNVRGMENIKSYWNSWKRSKSKTFTIESPRIPVIGVHPKTHLKIRHFLKEEGLPFDISDDSGLYGVYIKEKYFEEQMKKQILYEVENTRFPLVRFWRWPENRCCCLSITGDIDGIDLFDYWMRFYG